MRRQVTYVDVDLRGGGGSILTTTHLARFRQYVFEAAVAEQIQGGGAAEHRMGLLQPAGLGQVGDMQGLQHLGQSVDHTVGAIGVELPEGEAPFALIKDPQKAAGLESVVHRLAAASCEELVHLGCTDGGGQELVAEGKAAPECFELVLGGIGGGLSQPFGERVVCLGGNGPFPRGHRGQRLQQCSLGWRIERRTAKLIENSGLKLSLWGHELRQGSCPA